MADDDRLSRDIVNLATGEQWIITRYSSRRVDFSDSLTDKPHTIVIDLGGLDPLSTQYVPALKRIAAKVPALIVSAQADFRTIRLCLAAGAIGYLLQPVSPSELKAAIIRAAHREATLCDTAQAAIVSWLHGVFSTSAHRGLSCREMQILLCLAQRQSDKEISASLNISPNTVHVYLVRLFRRLNVHTRNEAISSFFAESSDTARPIGPSNSSAMRSAHRSD